MKDEMRMRGSGSSTKNVGAIDENDADNDVDAVAVIDGYYYLGEYDDAGPSIFGRLGSTLWVVASVRRRP